MRTKASGCQGKNDRIFNFQKVKGNLFLKSSFSSSFCLQILSGLRHCHQHSIVHADVKPANVIVSPHGICKLGDFGHSIVHPESANEGDSHAEDVVGTVAYAAPEVLRGARPTPSSDMYSYGILLWQVESRELPFSGEHPHVIIYKVSGIFNSRPWVLRPVTPQANFLRLNWSRGKERVIKV